jgi:hypothetical protein
LLPSHGTILFSIEFSIIGGTLVSNATQGFENNNLKTTDVINNYSYAGIRYNSRYLNILTLTYSPLFFKNFYLHFIVKLMNS